RPVVSSMTFTRTGERPGPGCAAWRMAIAPPRAAATSVTRAASRSISPRTSPRERGNESARQQHEDDAGVENEPPLTLDDVVAKGDQHAERRRQEKHQDARGQNPVGKRVAGPYQGKQQAHRQNRPTQHRADRQHASHDPLECEQVAAHRIALISIIAATKPSTPASRRRSQAVSARAPSFSPTPEPAWVPMIAAAASVAARSPGP